MPAIISEKNTPIDSAVPEFWNVDRIPEAAPRWRAGTLLMIEDEFGALNMPDADPVHRDQQRERRVGEVDGQQHQADEARARTRACRRWRSPREPNRSDRYPEIGPEIRNAVVSGSR